MNSKNSKSHSETAAPSSSNNSERIKDINRSSLENEKKQNNTNESSYKTQNHKESGSDSIGKWILFCALILGIALISESLNERFVPSINQIEMGSKDHFVSRDLYKLYTEGKLPKTFFDIKTIKWNYYDEDLKRQIPPDSLPFVTSNSGRYLLEVDAFSSPNEKNKVTVLQMSLINIETNNKIWELSRNYEIPNERKPTRKSAAEN